MASTNTRNAILKGAAQSFARLGYGTTRVEDIIEDAGISRATFYKFFDSKEQVFDAIEEAFNFSFMQAMESASDADLEAGARADAMLEAYLRWMTGWRDLSRVMWFDPTRPRAQEMVESRHETFTAFIKLMAQFSNEMGLVEADDYLYRGVAGAIAEIGMALTARNRIREADIQRAHKVITYVISQLLSDVPPELAKKQK